MKKLNLRAFTFVELMIVMIIIAILGVVWFYSYVWYLAESRDSQRKADLSQVSSAFKIYKQKRWYYAIPWETFNITYSWSAVATQWKLDTNVRLSSLESLPSDPKNEKFYIYSTTVDKQEFELYATLENAEEPIAIVNWNYKSVSKNILPALLLATWATIWSDVEIQSWSLLWDVNRKLFIYNEQQHNLWYTFEEPFSPTSDWTSFDALLSEMENQGVYWQNSDFRNCIEIEEWGKLLLPLSATAFEYQIITSTWALVNTWCTL